MSSQDWLYRPMIFHHQIAVQEAKQWHRCQIQFCSWSIASSSQWFHRRHQGGETTPHPPLGRFGKRGEASWPDVPVWAVRTSVFPQGSAEGWGLCFQAPCSSLLSSDSAYFLREVIWDAQALISCQEKAVSGLRAIISRFVPFPRWWQISTSWALLQLLSDFFCFFKQISLVLPLWKRTVQGA